MLHLPSWIQMWAGIYIKLQYDELHQKSILPGRHTGFLNFELPLWKLRSIQQLQITR